MTAPVSTLAVQLGLDEVRDRGRFVPEIIRLIYTPPAHRQPRLSLGAPAAPGAPPPRAYVPLPLTAGVWSDAVFRRPVATDRLLATILSDRRAALLCRGLAGLDDETLVFYAEHPQLLTYLYDTAAPAFGAFGASLRVKDNRIVVPGGRDAARLWEAVTMAPLDKPETFLRAMFKEPDARLAYVFDVLAAATPESRAFGLGMWMPDEALRVVRFQQIVADVRASYQEWDVDELPFARPLNDLAILLLRLGVRESGEPAPPAGRLFWSAALGAATGSDAAAGPAAGLVDAAWLVQAVQGGMYVRGDRLDQIGFAQRVFARIDAADLEDAASVVAELPTRRMLLLTLERIGVTKPSVYLAALRQSRAVAGRGSAAFWALAQFQGALAVLDRMSRVGTIDAPATESLLLALFSLPLQDGAFHGALAGWFEQQLAPRLPAGETMEAQLIAAVAGPPTPPRLVVWEDETYRLDLSFAERRRIERLRDKQGGVDLGLAIALWTLAEDATRSSSADAIRLLASRAGQLLETAGPMLSRPAVSLAPSGVSLPPDGRDWLARMQEELERAARSGDVRRARRAGESLRELDDLVLGQALLSFVYAMYLGDPEGPALLGANVAFRHDFGFGRQDGGGRERTPWLLPRQDFRPGVPWHVTGSLLGLDVALAPLTLRRLTLDAPATPPQLRSIDREAFAVNVALLDPRRLADGDRDRISLAIGRGRARVGELGRAPDQLARVVDELALDGWRERTLRWALLNEPDSVDNHFSLAELLALGGGTANLDAWGTSGLLSAGCVCTRFPAPWLWRVLAGRSQAPMLAAVTVDMNLALAQRFVELRLPAALLPSVLATAMQDFVDRAESTDPGDAAGLLRYSLSIPLHAIEDYVAAGATLDGPLVVDEPAEAVR